MYSDLCYNAGCVQNVIFCKSFRNRVSHDNRARKLFFQTPFPGAFFSVFFFKQFDFFLNRRNISFFFSVNIFQSCRCVRFLIKKSPHALHDQHNDKRCRKNTYRKNDLPFCFLFYFLHLYCFPIIILILFYK